MFIIRLYHFSKKTNSTKTPLLSSGEKFNCLIRSSSSIINPTIEIEAKTPALLTYNYAKIDDFGDRYYFIDNIVYEQGIYVLQLSVDVLSTYKQDILNSHQYVVRAASDSAYDLNIADTAYPVVARKNKKNWGRANYPGITDHVYGASYKILQTGDEGTVDKYFNVNLQNGEFVLGIVGSNETGMNYFVFEYEGFKELIEKVFNISPSNMTDLAPGTANALYDPMSLLVSCKWYPEIPADCKSELKNQLYIGNQQVSMFWGYRDLYIDKIPEFYTTFNIPKHPPISGDFCPDYLNLSPYTELNLYFPPFGSIPLDTTKVFPLSEVDVHWAVDYSVGISHLKILGTDSDSSGILSEITSDYGVTIPISTLITDWKTGLLTSALTFVDNTAVGEFIDSGKSWIQKGWNWITNKIGDLTGGKINIPAAQATENKSLLGTAADLIASAKGQIQTNGSIGSFLSFNEGAPYIYAYFYYQADRDVERFGAPANRQLVLSNHSGYILCANAYVNYEIKTPTDSEAAAVETALNNGVYLE